MLEVALSFITLTILEIVLGIDNLIFIAIISQKLPVHQQKRVRQIGLTLAWITRLILLGTAIWITKLTQPLITIYNFDFSGRDMFLLAGGLFLLFKATQEIHYELEPHESSKVKPSKTSFISVIIQIGLIDIVFSLDSILTAIGLTDNFWLMASAITIAIITMLFASEPMSRFINKNPTIKMLALSFLILIGMILIADSFHNHIPRGYIYFAMGFSLLTEGLNIIQRKRRAKIKSK